MQRPTAKDEVKLVKSWGIVGGRIEGAREVKDTPKTLQNQLTYAHRVPQRLNYQTQSMHRMDLGPLHIPNSWQLGLHVGLLTAEREMYLTLWLAFTFLPNWLLCLVSIGEYVPSTMATSYCTGIDSLGSPPLF